MNRTDLLEQGRVEIILRNDDLNEDEKRSEGYRDETVDERSVESGRLNEGGGESTNEQILPERVSRRSDHQAIQLG